MTILHIVPLFASEPRYSHMYSIEDWSGQQAPKPNANFNRPAVVLLGLNESLSGTEQAVCGQNNIRVSRFLRCGAVWPNNNKAPAVAEAESPPWHTNCGLWPGHHSKCYLIVSCKFCVALTLAYFYAGDSLSHSPSPNQQCECLSCLSYIQYSAIYSHSMALTAQWPRGLTDWLTEWTSE